MPREVGLVPLDGSATAECVLPWAAAVARGLGLRLVLLQVVRAEPAAGERTEAALRAAGDRIAQPVERRSVQPRATAAVISIAVRSSSRPASRYTPSAQM